ncbi:uncharacterized protein LOC131886248 [Tigriopus californicus]|uniref:uncharacterized protein LOC131886248 n=1 Tax=Tigriopus californicus TaxID=6832 RepID=UPI0027DA44D1|nr:uncharacterized protein LOC131886248 [Tigriopus californicus]
MTKLVLLILFHVVVTGSTNVTSEEYWQPVHNVQFINEGIAVVPFRTAVSDSEFFEGKVYPLVDAPSGFCNISPDEKKFIIFHPMAPFFAILKWLHCLGNNTNFTLVFSSKFADRHLSQAQGQYDANIMFLSAKNAIFLLTSPEREHSLASVDRDGELVIENIGFRGLALFGDNQIVGGILVLFMLVQFLLMNGRCQIRDNVTKLRRKISRVAKRRAQNVPPTQGNRPNRGHDNNNDDIGIEMEVCEVAQL